MLLRHPRVTLWSETMQLAELIPRDEALEFLFSAAEAVDVLAWLELEC